MIEYITSLDSVGKIGFFEKEFLGNAVASYIDAALIFVIFGFLFFLLERLFLHRLKKAALRTQSDIDDIVIEVVEGIKPAFYWFIALYLAVMTLHVSENVSRVIFVVMTLWVVWQVMQVMQLVVAYITRKAMEREQDDQNTQSAISLLSSIVKFVLWIIAILLILSNLGVNVTSLIAGVGIGGVAIAFAVQGILEDLFSSFSLYFDKPFVIGDTIEVNGEMGIVQKIGIKTTRLKSLSTGEEIVVSNKELTTAQVHNYHRMDRRRVTFSLGVTYDTPTDTLKKIPQVIEEIITAQEHITYERTHFRAFEDSALSFTVLYYVESRDYNEYLDIHQNILFGIREAFDADGIVFAYPTQTIYIEGDKK